MQQQPHIFIRTNHKLRFVWFGLLCVLGLLAYSFYNNEIVACRVETAHFSQTHSTPQNQNLFCESIEKEEKEDKEEKEKESNNAHLSVTVVPSAHVFYTKKTLLHPPYIACFENEAIEKETPPPDCSVSVIPPLRG